MSSFYQLNRDQLEDGLAKVKNIIIAQLYEEEKIDKETFEEWIDNRALMVRTPNIFKRVWNSFTREKQEKGLSSYVLVKQLNLVVEEN